MLQNIYLRLNLNSKLLFNGVLYLTCQINHFGSCRFTQIYQYKSLAVVHTYVAPAITF